MHRVLVLGKTGMLGSMVFRVLSSHKTLHVEGTHRLDSSDPLFFDVEDGIQPLRTLARRGNGYHYVINCIGVTPREINERDSKSIRSAIRINALFPQELGVFSEEMSARIIHISTDAVFSGRQGPYLEDSPHDCVDVYGKTKSLGEAVRDRFLNVRCSIIGTDPIEKKGLLEWFLAQSNPVIQGYIDFEWNGVTTLQFAQLCAKIILEDRFDDLRKESHVYHFCPNNPVSKYELLKIFQRVFLKETEIVRARLGLTSLCRVLLSKYNAFDLLFGQGLAMEDAVRQLSHAPLSKSSAPS